MHRNQLYEICQYMYIQYTDIHILWNDILYNYLINENANKIASMFEHYTGTHIYPYILNTGQDFLNVSKTSICVKLCFPIEI